MELRRDLWELWGFIEILAKTEQKLSLKNSSAISQLTFQPNHPSFDNF
jgi:hypothetical protein